MDSILSDTLTDVPGDDVGYALRLPPALKEKLKRWGRASRRSINGQIVAVLIDAVARAERKGEIPPEASPDAHD